MGKREKWTWVAILAGPLLVIVTYASFFFGFASLFLDITGLSQADKQQWLGLLAVSLYATAVLGVSVGVARLIVVYAVLPRIELAEQNRRRRDEKRQKARLFSTFWPVSSDTDKELLEAILSEEHYEHSTERGHLSLDDYGRIITKFVRVANTREKGWKRYLHLLVLDPDIESVARAAVGEWEKSQVRDAVINLDENQRLFLSYLTLPASSFGDLEHPDNIPMQVYRAARKTAGTRLGSMAWVDNTTQRFSLNPSHVGTLEKLGGFELVRNELTLRLEAVDGAVQDRVGRPIHQNRAAPNKEPPRI